MDKSLLKKCFPKITLIGVYVVPNKNKSYDPFWWMVQL